MRPLEKQFRRLARQLAQISWICHGSLVQQYQIKHRRGQRLRYGPYPIWTCKLNNKTRTRVLSKVQAQKLAKAIASRRKLERLLDGMYRLSGQWLLQKGPAKINSK